MCGRFTLKTPTKTIASLFSGLDFPQLPLRFNIAPTQMVTCIKAESSTEQAVHSFRWGLVPFWAKDLKIGAKMINARAETIADKPAFRAAFKKRRCLILADGFYEWKKVGKSKFPHYITLAEEQPFAMAGLWEQWGKGEERVETCTIITTEANEVMEPLHHRMPVILEPENHDFWLDPEFKDSESLKKLLVPYRPSDMRTREVNPIVNKATNETPECIEPIRTLFD